MATSRGDHLSSDADAGVAGAMLHAFDSPALLAQDSGSILAANAAWRELFAGSQSQASLPTIAQWLAQLTDGDALAAALAATGFRTACVSHQGGNGVRRFVVRVTTAQGSERWGRTHLVVMSDASPPCLCSSLDHRQHRMDRLLVRQTLIEERERRRLGRALHDQVTQLLVQVRRRLADTRDRRATPDSAEMVVDVDRVIHLIQEITSNFSPPVLEDLGLLPAMQWLADHLRSNYNAVVRSEDDGVEPSLTPEVRTIAFRAIRELSNNAVKHAPGAGIRLSASTANNRCRLEVRDDGPGFSPGEVATSHDGPQPFPGYGLLSIEQQIRAVGGVFEIDSTPGEGTRAVITVRCECAAPMVGSDRGG